VDAVTTDALTFAQALLDRGMELLIRKNRLYVWPGKAYKRGLSAAERDYIREHRAELKELAASGALPETTVVWQPPTTPAPPPCAPRCAYCGRPCVGPYHWAYRLLHHTDPTEVARRDAEATADMFAMLRRGRQEAHASQ
jgi:hypothetical protein